MTEANAIQARYEALRDKMNSLISEAQANERKLQRLQNFELELVQTSDLQALIVMLLEAFPAQFDLDYLSLVLVDDDQSLQQFYGTRFESSGVPENLILLPQDETSLLQAGAYLGAFDAKRFQQWFPKAPDDLASIAVLPLARGQRCLGQLQLGSCDPEMYQESLGSLFLERFVAIVGVCVENAVNFHRLADLSYTDTLTGVRNRRYLQQRLLEEIGRADREELPLNCLFIDIDKFKTINDRHGHLVGDHVIYELAQRISQQLRQFDILARYGGEEFVVVLPEVSFAQAKLIAERIRFAVQIHPMGQWDDEQLSVTVSVGIAASMPGSGKSLDVQAKELLEMADAAMLNAKRAGRNQIATAYDPEDEAGISV